MQKRRLPRIVRRWLGDRSVRQGAIALGVVENTLHSWINGTSLPPAVRIAHIANMMGVGEGALRRAVEADRTIRREESGAVAILPGSTEHTGIDA